MRRGLHFVATLVVAMACSSEKVRFDAPPRTDEKTLVLIVDGTPTRAFVFDLTATSARFELSFVEGTRVYALLYDESPTDLVLSLDQLEIVSDERPDSRLLPENHDRVMAATLSSEPTVWMDVAPPDVVRRLRFRVDDPCAGAPQFDLTLHPMEEKTNSIDILSFDDGSALITTEAGTFYRLDKTSLRKVTFDPPRPSGGLYRDAAGDVWFGGKDGELVRTRDDVVIERFTSPMLGELSRMDGPKTLDDPFELLVLDRSTSSFLWFDGAAFETVHVGAGRINFGGVAWTGRRQGIAVGGMRSVAFVIDGSTVREENPGTVAEGLHEIYVHPQLGTFIGTDTGFLLRRVGDSWRSVGDLGGDVNVLVPYEDGIVMGGDFNYFGWWSPSRAFCATQLFPASVIAMTVIGDDIAVALRSGLPFNPEGSTQPTFAVWMTRVDR